MMWRTIFKTDNACMRAESFKQAREVCGDKVYANIDRDGLNVKVNCSKDKYLEYVQAVIDVISPKVVSFDNRAFE